MSKLPMESRPIRLVPEVARAVEERLRPLKGKELEAAQMAVLRVYQSGMQLPAEQWVTAYTNAIDDATGHREAAA